MPGRKVNKNRMMISVMEVRGSLVHGNMGGGGVGGVVEWKC